MKTFPENIEKQAFLVFGEQKDRKNFKIRGRNTTSPDICAAGSTFYIPDGIQCGAGL